MAGKLGGAIMRSWEFSGDFIEIAEKWSDLAYQTKEISYIDFVRIGAFYNDVLGKGLPDEDKYQQFIDKGIIEDVTLFKSEEFTKSLNDIKTVFA